MMSESFHLFEEWDNKAMLLHALVFLFFLRLSTHSVFSVRLLVPSLSLGRPPCFLNALGEIRGKLRFAGGNAFPLQQQHHRPTLLSILLPAREGARAVTTSSSAKRSF